MGKIFTTGKRLTMNIKKAGFLGIVTLYLCCFGVSSVIAEEIATITNDSDEVVSFYLKWNSAKRESGLITLAPGEWWRVNGPAGAKLWIRYNSTPGLNFIKEIKSQIISADVADGQGFGYKSFFRQTNLGSVWLFRD